jgi:hypothetical protein
MRLRRGSIRFRVSHGIVERIDRIDEKQILIAAVSSGSSFREHERKHVFDWSMLRIFDCRSRSHTPILEENHIADSDERVMFGFWWR